MSSPVVVLAGGSGGAKLARGMLDVVGADELVVIANTGDDVEIYGAYVSPDPDLVTFWLADQIDGRGWGLRDDTFRVMVVAAIVGAVMGLLLRRQPAVLLMMESTTEPEPVSSHSFIA